jgi:hypothetical protein
MKFLHNAGEVESTITSRTRTYLEGKPEEDNSMSVSAPKEASDLLSRENVTSLRRGE